MYQQASQSSWLKLPLLLVNSEPSSLVFSAAPCGFRETFLCILLCQSLTLCPVTRSLWGACSLSQLCPPSFLQQRKCVHLASNWSCLCKLWKSSLNSGSCRLVLIFHNDTLKLVFLLFSEQFLPLLTLLKYANLPSRYMLQWTVFLKVFLPYFQVIVVQISFEGLVFLHHLISLLFTSLSASLRSVMVKTVRFSLKMNSILGKPVTLPCL